MNKLRYLLVIVTMYILLPIQLHAEGLPPCRLVTTPTAGSLQGRTFMLDTQLYDGGGVVHMISIGIIDLVNVGVSYGGSHIIGSSHITWQPHACIQARVRIVEETMKNPAVSIGFDSQGDGPYRAGKGFNRFRLKSRGAYLVISRNYNLLGNLGFHGGVNYSLETDDNDRDPSFWGGVDKDIGNYIQLCCEYDFATNDNEDESITSNRGYLNAAIKWYVGNAFALEFDLKNILRNNKKDIMGHFNDKPEASREIRIMYRGRF